VARAISIGTIISVSFIGPLACSGVEASPFAGSIKTAEFSTKALPTSLRSCRPAVENVQGSIASSSAAETANRTMHGVMHIGWVPDGTGGYRGQMAVLVKPNGLFGTAYIAAIMPFRHLTVYPAMMREIGREWRALAGDPTPAHA
jgi:hypothetical protein